MFERKSCGVKLSVVQDELREDLNAQRNLANKYESLLLDMSRSCMPDVSVGQLDESVDIRSEEGESVQYIAPLHGKPYLSEKSCAAAV